MSFWRSLINSILESMRYPSTLIDFLRRSESVCPDINPPDRRHGVGEESLVRWDRLWETMDSRPYDDADLLQWDFRLGPGRSDMVRIEALAHLVRIATHDSCEIDICDVDAISASKANLSQYYNLDHFAETACRNLIRDVSVANLNQLLAHGEIRILNMLHHTDSFRRLSWDRRIVWVNSGGSHHFAAARYLARRLGISVPIRATLREISICRDAVARLAAEYRAYIVNNDSVASDKERSLLDALGSFRTVVLIRALPYHLGIGNILLFPRSDRRSMRAARVLAEYGAVDLIHLLRRLAIQ